MSTMAVTSCNPLGVARVSAAFRMTLPGRVSGVRIMPIRRTSSEAEVERYMRQK